VAAEAGAEAVAEVAGVGDEVAAGPRNHRAKITQAIRRSAACSYKRTSS
jgi:hypothetical protein